MNFRKEISRFEVFMEHFPRSVESAVTTAKVVCLWFLEGTTPQETFQSHQVTQQRIILEHSWCFAKWNENESRRTRGKPLPCTSGCCISIPISGPCQNIRLLQKTTKLSPLTLKCSLFPLYLTPNSNLFSFQCSVSEFKLLNCESETTTREKPLMRILKWCNSSSHYHD